VDLYIYVCLTQSVAIMIKEQRYFQLYLQKPEYLKQNEPTVDIKRFLVKRQSCCRNDRSSDTILFLNLSLGNFLRKWKPTIARLAYF
jgi:hypothetical protein